MSRSRKDGRHGGAHDRKRREGAEYGGRRGEAMMVPGRWSKQRTHRLERRANTRAERDALKEAA